ncbi:MAG: hypothetical protein JJU36_10105 [Phycisphaeraceae bacterium]|nr:hypothetical protein [Phycisphaeraceae bacterium]
MKRKPRSKPTGNTEPLPAPQLVPANQCPEPMTEDDRRCLVLEKGGKKLVIRYGPGEEARVIAGLRELAGRNDSDLTWFDAAVLSHELGKRLKARLERFKPAA